nr:retrovirus-related Pol polyprotein from transposon TNT 1-94 [Tanacetum cinerariifolium]
MLQKETLLDVVGTSVCHCVVLQSFLVERIKPKSVERASILHQPDGVRSQRHHIVSYGELNGVSIALVVDLQAEAVDPKCGMLSKRNLKSLLHQSVKVKVMMHIKANDRPPKEEKWAKSQKTSKDYKVEYKKMKAKLALFEAILSTSQSPKPFQLKAKRLVAETFDWDKEEVSDDEEMTQVKVLMALADDELTVGRIMLVMVNGSTSP